MVCDFCGSPDVRWRFRCDNIRALVIEVSDDLQSGSSTPWNSYGDWAACPACKALIAATDHHRLAARSARRLVRKSPGMPYDTAYMAVRALHDTFFANRVGDPIPTTPDRSTI
jgi:hypothetical protein